MHAFDVLGDPVRRRILEMLTDGERTSGSVVEVIGREFGISQPAVSQHLRVLRENGFATVRPEGTRRLYAVERTLPPLDTAGHIERRRAIRQARARPVLAELKAWLDGEAKTMLPKSPLAEAVRYVLNRWPAFERYTERGDLTIDNNLSERTLRPIAVGRGNWTFLGSASAGGCAAKHYTVVGTCRHLGIDPFAYLRDTLPALHALGEKPTPEQLADLLPDRWAARRVAADSSAKPAA